MQTPYISVKKNINTTVTVCFTKTNTYTNTNTNHLTNITKTVELMHINNTRHPCIYRYILSQPPIPHKVSDFNKKKDKRRDMIDKEKETHGIVHVYVYIHSSPIKSSPREKIIYLRLQKKKFTPKKLQEKTNFFLLLLRHIYKLKLRNMNNSLHSTVYILNSVFISY